MINLNSFLLSIIIFLINGVSVLRFYQIKDYLYKRVIAQFYFPSSKILVFNKKEYFLYFLFLIFLVFTFFYDLRNFWDLSALIFLVILFFVLRFNFLKKIHFTPKAIVVSFLVLIFNSILLVTNNNHPAIFILLSTWIWQFIIFTLSIKIFDLGVKPYLNYLGKKTKEKIEKIKKENHNFKIIGIVGSYGKSSTKEFLVQLLKEKHRVLATPPRINHEYALLKFLLNVKIENYDFLIIEFGSYYLGNIKWTSQFIIPDIAYITGITKQHLFLFGSIENIIIGEGTEILSWMKEGILFVNKNHQYFEKLQEKIKEIADSKIKIYTYGFSADFSYRILENNLEKSIFEITREDADINADKRGTLTQKNAENEDPYNSALFGFNSGNIFGSNSGKYLIRVDPRDNNPRKSAFRYIFETKIIFPMQIENLCGALAYISLIDDLENYREKIKNLELPEDFLRLKIKNNLYIFDDSYNANPKGVFDGLKYFQSLDFDYKIIIFNGLLELGKETKEIYQELAKEFLAFDKIIITSYDFQEIIKNDADLRGSAFAKASADKFTTRINADNRKDADSRGTKYVDKRRKHNKNSRRFVGNNICDDSRPFALNNIRDDLLDLLKGKLLLITKKEEIELFLQSLKQPKVGIWIFNRFPEKVKINL